MRRVESEFLQDKRRHAIRECRFAHKSMAIPKTKTDKELGSGTTGRRLKDCKPTNLLF
jgi:hypothetical protein